MPKSYLRELEQKHEELLKDLEEARELLADSRQVESGGYQFLHPMESSLDVWLHRRNAFLHKTAPGIAQRGEGDE